MSEEWKTLEQISKWDRRLDNIQQKIDALDPAFSTFDDVRVILTELLDFVRNA